MLCETCLRFVRLPLPEDEHGHAPHHDKTSTFLKSVKAGCYICSAVWGFYSEELQSAFSREAVDDRDPPAIYTVAQCNWVRDNSPSLHVYGVSRPGFGNREVATSFSLMNSERMIIRAVLFSPVVGLIVVGLAPYENREVLEDSTGSSTTWRLAENWLNECINNHTECAFNGKKWYPERLLEISGSNLRLIETSGRSLQGHYLTLSHCWGTLNLPKLTKTSYERFVNQNPVHELPRTFQDFVTVAQRLKVSYIWIDCLCILQDSIADWQRESSSMQDVYANALCNIAATGARDSSDGLFQTRDVRLVQHTSVEIPSQSNSEIQQSFKLVNLDFWDFNVYLAPLNRRAWVLQERMLARRVLHFGKHQLLFECRHSIACETYPTNMKRLLPWVNRCISLIEFRPHNGIPAEQRLTAGRDSLWSAIVRTYTSADLTVPGDKAVAIAGIAKRFQSVSNVQYIAGMWNTDLHCQLSWIVQNQKNGKPRERVVPYRAPSFSWISVERVVRNFQEIRPEPASSILDIDINPVTSDRTSALQGGYMRIKGTLRRMMLRFKDQKSTLNNYDVSILLPHNYIHFDVEPASDQQESRCFLINLCYSPNISDVKSEEMRYVTGLILEPVDSIAGVFRRIGLLRHKQYAIQDDVGRFSESRMDPAMYLHNHADDEGQFPCEEFDPISREHTIKII